MSKLRDENGKAGSVLVVGGGIAGIHAALDLVNNGFKVYLLEEKAAIGGKMAQLDKTFPTFLCEFCNNYRTSGRIGCLEGSYLTNDCSMCTIFPAVFETGKHRDITLLTNAEVKRLEGEAGRFTVQVKQRFQYIDLETCTGCGDCVAACPVEVADEFEEGLVKRKAVFKPYPQAAPVGYTIDAEHCTRCGACVERCLVSAIDLTRGDKIRELKVGSIILSPGFETFDATIKGEYGYGRYPNVVTSLELERMLSPFSPFKGKLVRPSDGRPAKKIAWIQCVGSRDSLCNKEYCSTICCMYATKQSILAKKYGEEVDSTIFYMENRTQGKGFDSYFEWTKEEYNVHFIRCMVSRVVERPGSKNLLLSYCNEGGELIEEEFDLVVLSVGLVPSKSTKGLAEKLGVELNEYGFCATKEFSPLKTSRPGIFTCGCFQGPKDIPESICQASGAASCAGATLCSVRGSLLSRKKELYQEMDISNEKPRIGVFICHCGKEISESIAIPVLREYLESLPYVARVEDDFYYCSAHGLERMKETIKRYNLNRVVLAGCSPKSYEAVFQENIREAGLNKYLLEMANILNQSASVHHNNPVLATEKARELINMAIVKVIKAKPLKEISEDFPKRGLVIGAGLSGLTAALALADQGYGVWLLEKQSEIGGNFNNIYYTLENSDVQSYLKHLIEKVKENHLIDVITDASIIDCSGYAGKFVTSIVSGPTRHFRNLEHAVTIIATGGSEYKPENEYHYGKDNRVITQVELEKRLARSDPDISAAKKIVMIQCVGSRIPERPYCSRVCCLQAIKNALKIKKKSPDTEICILYRDIRTYGFYERYYKEARELGVLFIRYDLENKPEVEIVDEALRVSVIDQAINRRVVIRPDCLVLSTGIVPSESAGLADMLQVPLTGDGFFLEYHMKQRPFEFAKEGIYLCGIAHAPKPASECIAQALATVSRAGKILSLKSITLGGVVAKVDEEKCAACLTCVRVCPDHTPFINAKGVAEIDPAKCRGCGMCVSECPGKAIQLTHFEDDQILSELKILLGNAA